MKGRVRWLLNELPELVEQGVVNEQAAKRLHDHYLPHLDGAGTGMRLLVVLGATLIGLGVILLIAHNWPQWTRDTRAVVSFMPLLLGQFLAAWTLLYRPRSLSWCEGSASFLFLSIGACIGLIEQTYHLGTKDYAGFLLTWILLGLPLVYLLRSATALLMAWAGLIGFAMVAQQQWGQALLFWPLWLAGIPFLIQQLRRAPWGLRSQLLSWAACLTLLCGAAASLERSVPGLWIVFYATLLSGIYLTHYRWLRTAPDVLRSPFQIVGVGGIVLLSMWLTIDWPWQRVGGDYLRSSWAYREFAGLIDYLMIAVLMVWWLGLIRRVLRRREWLQFLYAVFPLLVTPMYGLAAYSQDVLLMTLAMNAYLFMLGTMTLRDGMRRNSAVSLNLGLAILCSLLLMRFFDSDLPFTIRGVVFVAIGVGFLATNAWLRRRIA